MRVCSSLLVLTALAVTACGATKLAAARCKASQLRFTDGTRWSEMTGEHATPVTLRNGSSEACVLDGFPSIRMVDARGAEVPFKYTHDGNSYVSKLTARPVLVRPGRTAVLLLTKYRCDIRTTALARRVLITLPGGGGVLVYPRQGRYALDYCPEKPSITIAVTPFLASFRDVRH